MGLNDVAWEQLFDRYSILEEISRYGYFEISANQIKQYREPRLMTKFDNRVNLPEIFRENRLAILPISRGDYTISPFMAYKDLEPPHPNMERVRIPTHLQSLMPQFIVSEAIALNCAYACGILHDFLEEDEITPTVSGRMSSGIFPFTILLENGEDLTIEVNNSQIEIDAAYEGLQSLTLFEAKRDLADDFLVRQLYYPFRAWHERVTKPVKSVFLVFSNGIFSLYQYEFEYFDDYNSLILTKQNNYAIATDISLADIENIVASIEVIAEPDIQFPQADDMSRIVNLIELLSVSALSKQDITSEYAFDERQTNYYTDAGRYLGLIDKNREAGEIAFQLSPLGRHIMRQDQRTRQLEIAFHILQHKPFYETMLLHLRHGIMPNRRTIMQIMRESDLFRVRADSTYFRRASTVISWINWILGIIDD